MISLQDLFVTELRDLYSAEKQLTLALPKMVRAAESDDLRAALEDHLQQTHDHVGRLERAFDILGESSRGPRCKGMEGLIEEGQEHVSEAEGPTRDAVVIASAQKVEHYEICGYGTVATYASLLGRNDIAKLLGQTLDEEKVADKTLTALAESHINQESLREGPSEARSGRRTPPATVADRGRGGNRRSGRRSPSRRSSGRRSR
jgi:ferritin-like metal-binding protein YciE